MSVVILMTLGNSGNCHTFEVGYLSRRSQHSLVTLPLLCPLAVGETTFAGRDFSGLEPARASRFRRAERFPVPRADGDWDSRDGFPFPPGKYHKVILTLGRIDLC